MTFEVGKCNRDILWNYVCQFGVTSSPRRPRRRPRRRLTLTNPENIGNRDLM